MMNSTLGVFFLLISTIVCQRGEKSDGRIVGGEAIRIEEAPYQVTLHYFDQHYCGGAIISKDFVLTAAHCTFGKLAKFYTVRAGSTKNYEGGDVHDVEKIINHPFHNIKTLDYDISILKLVTSLRINDLTIQEISLPYLGEPLPETTAILVSGWGDTMNDDEPSSELRAVILTVSNQLKCNAKYIKDGGVTNRMVCAQTLKKDACGGDSGGPVRRLSDGTLVGLVSFGPSGRCADDDWPGVYTRIPTFRSWIYYYTRV